MSNWRDEDIDEAKAARQARWRSRPEAGELPAAAEEAGSEADPLRAAAQAKWRATPDGVQEDEAARAARQAKWRSAGEATARSSRETSPPSRARASQSRPNLGLIIWAPLAISLAAAGAGGYALYKEVRTGERVERYHAEVMAISARLGNAAPAQDAAAGGDSKIPER